jgi:hypothetical protein
MIKRFLIVLIATFSTTFLRSCGGNDFDIFKDKVEEFGKDKTISIQEWEELLEDVELHNGDRDFRRFFKNNLLDKQKLEKYITNLGFLLAEEQTDSPSANFVNIYIENSGSMFGYVNGNTGFKNALTKLLVELKSNYQQKNIKLNFINKRITPIKLEGDIAYFPKNKLSNIGDQDSGDSDINQIFKQVLDSTSSNTISILFSDCVYSVGKDVKNNDVDGALKLQKSLTEGIFKNTIKNKGFSTLFAHLESDFNGIYYTKNNSKIPLDGQEIPYYITIIGAEKEINKFGFIDVLDGFKNKSVFTTQNYSENTFYSVIQTNEDNGSFKPSKVSNLNPNRIQSIESIRVQERQGENFIFSLVVDFSNLPVDQNYLLSKNNYKINNGDYLIKDIVPYDKNILKPNSLVKLERNTQIPTHIFIIESNSNKYSDLNFSLKKNVPQWIYDLSTNDDSTIKSEVNQTFGIKYLAEGIFEAYENSSRNKNYITLTINIKK